MKLLNREQTEETAKAGRDDLIAALKPILAISDRKHDALDNAHKLMAKYEGEKHG